MHFTHERTHSFRDPRGGLPFMQNTSSRRGGNNNGREGEAEERVVDRGGDEGGTRRLFETRLGRPREFDVPRREKEASKSENDLSC